MAAFWHALHAACRIKDGFYAPPCLQAMPDKDSRRRSGSGPCPACRRDFAEHTDAEVLGCARAIVASVH